VADLMAREDARLLTLTGAGGTGKTRLAVQSAAEAAELFPDGMTWVSLAALRDSTLVLPTVAQALELPPRTSREIGERIASALAGKRQLLLLDNAEHLLPHVATDVAFLRDIDGPTVLVTSRERLQLQGEHVYAVPSLDDEDGVELFTARAAALDASFTPTAAVAELCARLDNLPLALELGAARTSLFGPEQLLERLGQRLDLLKGGRDADPRQQTLRATIEWSHDLLSAEEKRLFRQLSVFAGSCTYQAAQVIARAEADTLQSLIDKSLVRRRETAFGLRYGMLDTIREFAAERLEETPDDEQVERAHAEFFTAFAERYLERRGRREDLRELLDEVTADHDNFRIALAWSLDHEEPDLAIRLFVSVHDYWLRRDHHVEGRRWAERALSAVDAVSPRLRERALYATAQFAFFSGDLETAGAFYSRSLEVARELGDEPLVAWIQLRLAMVDSVRGDPLAARRQLEESLRLSRAVGDQRTTAVALHYLGEVERDLGNTHRAKRLLVESVELLRTHGTAARLGATLHSLGDVLLDEEAFEDATSYYAEALELARVLGSDRDTAYCLAGLATVAAGADARDKAGRLWGAVEAIEDRIQVRLLEADRARYERALGELDPQLIEEGRKLDLDAAVSLALENRN
jgi:predicted ATPase